MEGVEQRITSPLTPSVPLAPPCLDQQEPHLSKGNNQQVSTVMLYGVPIVSLSIDNVERLCLAQISNTLLKDFSYNEIHNRRVALGITCVQCTPVQLEILRRAGAMPISSRRCGMITKREAERLCKSFLGDNTPPKLPENFAFDVMHECAWGCRGSFVPSRYNSSRAKCIKCLYCAMFYSPNKFVFHSHRLADSKYVQPDAANFNSWRRHIRLDGDPPIEVVHAWEDVKAMFNGGTRKRLMAVNSQRRVFPQGHSSRVKSPRLEAPHTKPPTFAPPALKAVGADLTYPPPYLAPLPPPYPAHHKDAHQSFVDYLWGSRSSLPPLGLPYPLAAWPRRPLPSFPPLPLSEPRPDPAADPRPPDSEPPVLRPAHLSAFTPVARASPTPPVGANRESGAPLPDSSRHSDDETVDIEATDDDTDYRGDNHKSNSYKQNCYKGDNHKVDGYKPTSTKHQSVEGSHYKSDGYKADDFPTDEAGDDHAPGEAEVEDSSTATPHARHEDRSHRDEKGQKEERARREEPSAREERGLREDSAHGLHPHGRGGSPIPSASTNGGGVGGLEPPRGALELPPASSDSPTTVTAAAEEDPRLKLFFLREMEAHRRVEQMARLKYTYTSHLHHSLHHTLHHSLHAALQPSHHLAKDWLDSSSNVTSTP